MRILRGFKPFFFGSGHGSPHCKDSVSMALTFLFALQRWRLVPCDLMANRSASCSED